MPTRAPGTTGRSRAPHCSKCPFGAVPAGTLVRLNAAWRFGPATLFGSVENLFGLRYAGTVEANEAFGRFYEAGSPTSVSVGLRLNGWGPAPGRGS
jgi:hypothetical protein